MFLVLGHGKYPCSPRSGFTDWKMKASREPFMSRYEDESDDAFEIAEWQPRRRSRPHSGLGIASFAMGVVAALLAVAMMGMAVAIAAKTQAQGGKPDMSQTMIVGFLAFGALGLAFVGMGVGFVGALQSERNKTFAITG